MSGLSPDRIGQEWETLQPKVAVVTGALKGLGFETARQLARQGYQVILTGRDAARGKAAQDQLAKECLKTEFRLLDTADLHSIEQFTKDVLKEFGRVDVLVNNAGIMVDGEKPSTLPEYASAIQRTFTTNALGPYLLSRALVPQMVKNNYGRIVNVTSGMGQLSEMNGGYPGYRMSKTALNAVTRMFADETRATNVLVNSVCPGWVRTDMGGKGATRSIEQGAKTIFWLATLPDGSPTGGFFRDKKPMAW
jgi:NAD(P)-dependent dehydrogenase (short-subunit alcohol dehydrogenase family)